MVIQATQVLHTGESWSTNRLRITLGADGNVVIYDQGAMVAQTSTAGRGGSRLVFQADGHLVLYSDSNATIWSSGTAGNDGAVLTLQADGNVTITLRGQLLWQTGTAK